MKMITVSYVDVIFAAGLHGYLNFKTCDEYTAPKRRLTIQQKQESQEWTYYIAAEEIIWDYAPNMPENMDGYVHRDLSIGHAFV